MEDRIEYFERMLADNPDNSPGLLALADEYNKADHAKSGWRQRWRANS